MNESSPMSRSNLAQKRNRQTQTIFDVDKLNKAETKRKFYLSLKNRFEVLGSHNTEDAGSIELIWSVLSSAYTESAEEILGI